MSFVSHEYATILRSCRGLLVLLLIGSQCGCGGTFQGTWCDAKTGPVATDRPQRRQLWERRFPDIDISDITLDPRDDVIVTGYLGGRARVDLGRTELENADEYPDAFIAKLDPNGKPLWGKNLDGHSYGWAVTADASGNVVAVGETWAKTGAKTDAFAVKLDAAGQPLWTKSLGARRAGDLAVDAAGSIFVALTTQREARLLHLDPDGRRLWSATLGEADDFVNGAPSLKLDIDSEGRLVMIWNDHDLARRASLPHKSSLGIGLLDSTGHVLWRRVFEDAFGHDVTFDSNGDVVIVGHLHEGNGEPPAGFAIKLAKNGRLLWATSLDPDVEPYKVTSDRRGGVIVVGSSINGLNACGRRIGANQIAFFSELDAAGSLRSAQQATTDGRAVIANGIGIDRRGALLLVGSSERPRQTCQEIYLPSLDAFVAKYGP